MKKILIITYQFPPDNIIAAYRPLAYARNFPKHDLDTTVVTHLLEKTPDQSAWQYHVSGTSPVLEEVEDYKVYRVPREQTWHQKLYLSLIKVPGLSKVLTFLLNAFGLFDLDLIASYLCFKRFLRDHLKDHSYDCVLTLYSPFYNLRLVHWIGRKYKIPFVTDWRDLHDLRLGDKSFVPSIKDRVYLSLQERYIKKYLKHSLFVTSAGVFWAEYLGKLAGKKGYEITNGYDQALFSGIEPFETDYFLISHVGTLYPDQNIEIFLEGLGLFLRDKRKDEVRVSFVGLKGNMLNRVKDIAARFVDPTIIQCQGRVPRNDALKLKKSSHILFYPCWLGVEGVYSGKIFEYMGSFRPVLLAPGDKDFLESVIIKGNLGSAEYTAEGVRDYLDLKFQEWKQYGDVLYSGDKNMVNSYSREVQAEKLANLIKRELNKGNAN